MRAQVAHWREVRRKLGLPLTSRGPRALEATAAAQGASAAELAALVRMCAARYVRKRMEPGAPGALHAGLLLRPCMPLCCPSGCAHACAVAVDNLCGGWILPECALLLSNSFPRRPHMAAYLLRQAQVEARSAAEGGRSQPVHRTCGA